MGLQHGQARLAHHMAVHGHRAQLDVQHGGGLADHPVGGGESVEPLPRGQPSQQRFDTAAGAGESLVTTAGDTAELIMGAEFALRAQPVIVHSHYIVLLYVCLTTVRPRARQTDGPNRHDRTLTFESRPTRACDGQKRLSINHQTVSTGVTPWRRDARPRT